MQKREEGEKNATASVGRSTVGKITLTVKSRSVKDVHHLIRQLALLSRIRSISLYIKTPNSTHNIAVIYHSPPESGLLREKTVLKALSQLADYFDREDVVIKGVIQTEGNEDEINELIKAFNTHNTVTVIN
jgi:hypothetical protein